MKISELADQVGVATSTVRYYERIGLLTLPDRTPSGYRDYDDDAVARLLFITRARKMGLSCDQIVDLVPIWDGANCAAAHARVAQLITDKKADIAQQIIELTQFSAQLDGVRAALEAATPPPACRTDLSCCVPDTKGNAPVPLVMSRKREER
ncbi:MAG: MerR family transcriptional regulator [Microthrixaceae bacterium]